MIESTDVLPKKAAMMGIEAAMNAYMKRIEVLAAEYSALDAEIQEFENTPQGPET